MVEQTLKSLEDLSDESDVFESRLDDAQLKATRDELLDEVTTWLHECAAHGRYFAPASPDRRALRTIMSSWNLKLRKLGRDSAGVELAAHEEEAGVPLDVDCPYPGLEPYREVNNAIFFGRRPLVDEYARHLTGSSNRILLIIGASGSGKSSLAMAGVLPKLKLEHGDEWLFPQPFIPGASPLRAMATSLSETPGVEESGSAIESALKTDTADALGYLEAVCSGRSPVLVIDQFEELFTVCRSADEQARFADILVALSESLPETATFRPRILLTIRTDYIARIETGAGLQYLHKRLFEAKNDRHLLPLDVDDIRRAIAEPARQVGLRFPTALVDQLAVETAALPNSLPSLQFALHRLWKTRPQDESGNPKDLITEDMVRGLPSVKEALGTVAEGIYEGFTANQQHICERLLQELVVLDETFEEPLRRRRWEAELVTVLRRSFSGPAEDPDHVIDAFVDEGLLRRFGEGDDHQLEVAHEALLRHWPRISDILDAHDVKETLNLVKQVGREAAEWIARGRSESYLNLKGDRLQRAQKHASKGWLEETESAEYVHACHELEARTLQERAQAEEDARRAREDREAAKDAELREAKAKAQAAEAKEAEARAAGREERLKTQRLYGLIGVAVVVVSLFGGLAWLGFKTERLSDEANAKRESIAKNLVAYTSIASTLPPWDDLDVAYTLVSRLKEPFRFALARALERMEDTVMVGQTRDVGLYANQDGSALLQNDRRSETLRVFLLENGSAEGVRPIEFELHDRLLVFSEVGPAMRSTGNTRLALLVFRRRDGPGFTLEAYRLDEQGAHLEHEEKGGALDDAVGLSRIALHRDGDRAALVAIAYQTGKSTVYTVDVRPGSKAISTNSADREKNVDQATAITFVDDTLITGRLDGQVTCGVGAHRKMPVFRPEDEGSPIRQAIHLPGGARLLLLRESGSVYELDCASDSPPSLVAVTRGALGLSLSVLPDSGEPLLSYMQDHKLRCLRITNGAWAEQPCNSLHQVQGSVPLGDGRQLTVEDGRIPAVHVYPLETLAGAYLGRHQGLQAGETTLRWQLPGSNQQPGPAAPNRNSAGPWTLRRDGSFYAPNTRGEVHLVALSPGGGRVAWLQRVPISERNERGAGQQSWMLLSSAARAVELIDPENWQYIPRKQLFTTPVAIAINEDGQIAHAEPEPRMMPPDDEGSPSTVRVDNEIIDAAGDPDGRNPKERTVSCLAFSPDGSRLVAGTITGRVMSWRKTVSDSTAMWQREPAHWSKRLAQMTAAGGKPGRPQEITACAVSDDGDAVLGGSDGAVVRLMADGRTQHLTQRVAFQFDSRVQAVAIQDDGEHRFFTALGEWQTSHCSRRGLPGQTVRVWDSAVTAMDDSFSPVASNCLPNQVVLALGDMDLGQYPPNLRLLTPTEIRKHLCWGCAVGEMTSRQMIDELEERATTKRAEVLDDDVLYERYGLRF